jgi:hypothetical protein
MREGVDPKRLYAREPKIVYVAGSTSRTDDGFGHEPSGVPDTFGSRCRVICSNEQVPSDLQCLVEALAAKSLPCGLKFGLSHCDVSQLDTHKT